MNPIQEYFYRIDEPERSTLLFLRKMILESDPDHITETFSFGLPFFKYKKKMLCYLYYSKKYKQHYISFYHGNKLDYPELLQEGRKKFKILLIDMEKDLPVSFIMDVIDDIKQYL